MAKWDFKIVGASFVKELVPVDGDVQFRSQSFMQPSFDLEGDKIVIKESGAYKSAVLFSQIGEIDGVAPTDIEDAYEKLLTLVENFNEGGGTPVTTPTLQDVVNEDGNLTDSAITFESAGNPNLRAQIEINGLAFIENDGVNEETTLFSSTGMQRNLDTNITLLDFETPTNTNNVVLVPNKTGTLAMLDDVPTKTSDLINDGDNGTSHFITLEDLPSNLILYPTTVSSGIGGYNKLVSSITDPSYNTVAVDVSTGTITGTDQLIAGLITSPNIIVGNPGIFNITTIGNIRKVSGAGQAEFYFRVYKRDVGGTETLILQSSNTPQITSAIYTEFSATGLWNDGVFISTDMIVMKFYGTKVGSGSSPTYDFQFGGTQPVRTLVPIPLTVVPNLSFNELSDVEITTPTNNQIPAYESATSLWKNKSITDILGYTPIKKIVSDTTSSSAVTGTTSETLCKTYTISENTFSDGDFMKCLVGLEKTGTAGTATVRIRINQTNDFATATLVGTYTPSAASHVTVLFKRDFLSFKSGVLKGINFNTSTQSDLQVGASYLFNTTTLSPTSDFYIYVSVINTSGADSTIVNQVQITN